MDTYIVVGRINENQIHTRAVLASDHHSASVKFERWLILAEGVEDMDVTCHIEHCTTYDLLVGVSKDLMR